MPLSAMIAAASFSGSDFTNTTAGVNGGGLAATNTAANVAAAISAVASGSLVSATVATAGAMSLQDEELLYNTAVNNGGLQFTGPANSPNIEFVNGGDSQTLSVDASRAAATTLTNAAGSYTGSVANTAFTVTANSGGTAYNGVKVYLVDTPETRVVPPPSTTPRPRASSFGQLYRRERHGQQRGQRH